MDLNNLIKCFSSRDCKKIYIKTLSANDNSKNQVYLGGSFDVINVFPFSDIVADHAGEWKRSRFKANIDFYWIDEDCEVYSAPYSQLILYPKYPEVRLSGFLKGCQNKPSQLMTQRLEGRLLFLSVTPEGKILGHVCHPESSLANEFKNFKTQETYGVFDVINISRTRKQEDSRISLLDELSRIHSTGWIGSKRLNSSGETVPCSAPNCGGYTLEAELGITPNGYSEPDFLGWEVKQFGVKQCYKTDASVITLMTPEPNGGYYKDYGVIDFTMKFGYKDKLGRPDRMNFGGIHRVNSIQKNTGLQLYVNGFDTDLHKIKDPSGEISLISENGMIAASWSFTSLLKHWQKKHANACYVPSLSLKKPFRKYRYCDLVHLGTGTSFDKFLKLMSNGLIYYDPGIKIENVSTKPKQKKRSQFRIKSKFLKELYHKNEFVDLNDY